MALKLSIMEEEDIPEFAEVDDMAMANWGLAQAMSRSNPTNEPRKRMIEEYMHKGFHADSRLTYLKVTDAETGEMVSAAVWRFVLEPEEGQSKDEAHEEESDETSKNNPNVPKEPGVSKGAGTPSVMVEMQRLWTEFRDECFPNQPYASMLNLVSNIIHRWTDLQKTYKFSSRIRSTNVEAQGACSSNGAVTKQTREISSVCCKPLKLG